MDTSRIESNIPRGNAKLDPIFIQRYVEQYKKYERIKSLLQSDSKVIHIFEDQCKEYERRKSLLQSRSSFLTHGFMIYKCEDCGNIYLMWLEKGLEERLFGPKKAVPFIITCPYCMGTAKDQTGYSYCNKTVNLPLKIDDTLNCFVNDPDSEYGLAVIQEADGNTRWNDPREIIYYKGLSVIYKHDIEPLRETERFKEQYELISSEWNNMLKFVNEFIANGDMILGDTNRQERRHPERYYKTKYKRPRKGDKPWQK